MSASTVTVDGNVVLAGYTIGNWSGISSGWDNAAVMKLDAEDGEVLWRYQVRAQRMPALCAPPSP